MKINVTVPTPAGLGNRMINIASLWALSKITNNEINVNWKKNSFCGCEFDDLLYALPGVTTNLTEGESFSAYIDNHKLWNPISILQDFNDQLNISVDKKIFLQHFLQCIKSLPYKKRLLI